jgi:hypothetical protein
MLHIVVKVWWARTCDEETNVFSLFLLAEQGNPNGLLFVWMCVQCVHGMDVTRGVGQCR